MSSFYFEKFEKSDDLIDAKHELKRLQNPERVNERIK